MTQLETQSEMEPAWMLSTRQTDTMMQCLVVAVDSVCGSFVHTIGSSIL